MKFGFRDFDAASFFTIFREAHDAGTPGKRATGALSTLHGSLTLTSHGGPRLGMTRTPKGDCLFWIEGPLGALLGGDTASLVHPSRLTDGLSAARAYARRFGFMINPFWRVTVARFDLATDVAFDSLQDAQLFLRAADALRIPGFVGGRFTGDGNVNIETIDISRRTKRGRFKQLRIYDRVAQHPPHEPGRVVRIERQFNRRHSAQPTVRAAARSAFADQLWNPKWGLEESVYSNEHDAADRVLDLVGTRWPDGHYHDGETLSEAVAFRLIGAAVSYARRGDAAWLNARQARRGRSELRAFGLLIDQRAREPFDVGAIFRTARSEWKAAETPRLSAASQGPDRQADDA